MVRIRWATYIPLHDILKWWNHRITSWCAMHIPTCKQATGGNLFPPGSLLPQEGSAKRSDGFNMRLAPQVSNDWVQQFEVLNNIRSADPPVEDVRYLAASQSSVHQGGVLVPFSHDIRVSIKGAHMGKGIPNTRFAKIEAKCYGPKTNQVSHMIGDFSKQQRSLVVKAACNPTQGH